MKLIYETNNNYNIKTITSLEDLMSELESCEYNYYGLRGATPENLDQIERGYLDCSFDFDHELGVPSDEYLNGTCALEVSNRLPEKTIMLMYKNAIKNYCYAHGTNTVLLIGGDRSDWGEDDDEIIIRNGNRGADVIAIVEIQ